MGIFILPNEMLDMVTSYLEDSSDWKNFRLICKDASTNRTVLLKLFSENLDCTRNSITSDVLDNLGELFNAHQDLMASLVKSLSLDANWGSFMFQPEHLGMALKSFTRLEKLSINAEQAFAVKNFDELVGNSTWPELWFLSLRGLIVDQRQVLGFLLRHRQSITHLKLCTPLMTDRNAWRNENERRDEGGLAWNIFLRRMVFMQKLEWITIPRAWSSWYHSYKSEYHFDTLRLENPGSDDGTSAGETLESDEDNASRRERMRTFLLTGGRLTNGWESSRTADEELDWQRQYEAEEWSKFERQHMAWEVKMRGALKTMETEIRHRRNWFYEWAKSKPKPSKSDRGLEYGSIGRREATLQPRIDDIVKALKYEPRRWRRLQEIRNSQDDVLGDWGCTDHPVRRR